ncbi:hypothetical protein RhiirA4_516821 [Rhizophagus irregularis]|uniref:Uncharacterized protein n=1 Tax=Rhizophagus irregularis TaxID=588596 RepID=A0A2I1HM32_9GLOM|nr:hypothetical protein RhiirA4_516821 [Rhizophagus irregularis]
MQETHYVNGISDSEENNTRDTTAVKCALLRTDGTRNRALGQIERVPIAIQTLLIPTTFHVIDSKDKTLLLETDWFKHNRSVLDFNNKSVQLTFLTKTIITPISIHIGEEIDNKINEIFDKYEYKDDLIEKEIHFFNSKSSKEERIMKQWYQQPLNYNPWDEKEEIPDQYNSLKDILNEYLIEEEDEDKMTTLHYFLLKQKKGMNGTFKRTYMLNRLQIINKLNFNKY